MNYQVSLLSCDTPGWAVPAPILVEHGSCQNVAVLGRQTRHFGMYGLEILIMANVLSIGDVLQKSGLVRETQSSLRNRMKMRLTVAYPRKQPMSNRIGMCRFEYSLRFIMFWKLVADVDS